MEITKIEVTIHEKRNHPFEYGHYDCEVSLAAEEFSKYSPELGDAIDTLRIIAREKVAEELDNWESDVREEEKKRNALNNAENEIYKLSFVHGKDYYDDRKQEVINLIQEAPEEYRDYLFDRLESKEQEWNSEEDEIPF